MSDRFMVVGAEGQLGRALVAQLGARCIWHGGRERLDVRDESGVTAAVAAAQPEVIVNASAYNAVDAAESNPEEAFAVNAFGPLFLARAAAATGARVVHVSSDYVFDGRTERPYGEDDVPAPLGVYGISKLAGENLVRGTDGVSALVVRTSAVFDRGASRSKGGSFVERMLSRARAGEALRVVDDQTTCPTYAPDLARSLVAAVDAGVDGLLHMTNDGAASWHEFAAAALELSGIDRAIERIATETLDLPAPRPAYSVLSGDRYDRLRLPPRRHWREALAAMLAVAER